MTDMSNHAQRRRPPLVVIVAAAVLALMVAVGFLWLRHVQSPSYSLDRLAEATGERDWNGVQRYMDAERVASAFVSFSLASSEGDGDELAAEQPLGGREGVPKEKHMGGVDGSKGASGAMTETFVRRFVEALRVGLQAGSLDANAGGLPRIMHGTSPRQVTYSDGGTAAAVLVEVPTSSGGTQQVTIRMEKADDRWRIVALDGIDDLLGAIE